MSALRKKKKYKNIKKKFLLKIKYGNKPMLNPADFFAKYGVTILDFVDHQNAFQLGYRVDLLPVEARKGAFITMNVDTIGFLI